jgi:uncharacterized BrkB/YihY/UPF0761 family membrane protein
LDLPFELNFVAAYGAAGSLITMLIWIYYAAQIVLFGAEFTRVYAQERGRGIRPAKHAVRVDRKEIGFNSMLVRVTDSLVTPIGQRW